MSDSGSKLYGATDVLFKVFYVFLAYAAVTALAYVGITQVFETKVVKKTVVEEHTVKPTTYDEVQAAWGAPAQTVPGDQVGAPADYTCGVWSLGDGVQVLACKPGGATA